MHERMLRLQVWHSPLFPASPRFGSWRYSAIRVRLQPREELKHEIYNNRLDHRRADFERDGAMACICNSFSGADGPVFCWILTIYASA
jgi:hypothetical protein